MKELSAIDKKCLGNMPMLINTIASVIYEMKGVLAPIYNDYKSFIVSKTDAENKQKFMLLKSRKSNENGIVKVFDDQDTEMVKERFLYEIKSRLEISYSLSFAQNTNDNQATFDIDIVYCSRDLDEKNIVCIQLFETSNTQKLTDDFIRLAKEKIAKICNFGKFDNNSSVWCEIIVDESITMERINNCATAFKEFILKPLLNI